MSGHWAANWIGTPWVAGESDCWTFARTIWREMWGLDVPAVDVDAADPKAARRAFGADPVAAGWREVADRAEGDGVMMALGRLPCHVGIWVSLPEGPHILHSVEGAGVIATPAARVGSLGYRIVGVYRHRDVPCSPM